MANTLPGLPLPRIAEPKQDGFCPFNGERCEAPFCEKDCAKSRSASDLRASIRSGNYRVSSSGSLGVGAAALFGFLIGSAGG